MAILDIFKYITSADIAAAEAGARLRRITRKPDDNGFTLIRFWDFTDARDAESFVMKLNSHGAYTDPKADGVAYTGTFYGEAVVAEGKDQRDVVVYQTLSPNKQFDKATDWTAVNCKESTKTVVITGLTDAQLATELSSYSSSTQGYRYEVRPRFNTETGRWDLYVTIHRGTALTLPELTVKQSSLSTVKTVREFNQSSETVDTTASQGEIVEANIRLNDFCLYDKEKVTDTSTQDIFEVGTLATMFKHEQTVMYENSRDAITVPSDFSGNGIYSAVNTLNEDGTYSGRLAYQYGTDEGEVTFESLRSASTERDTTLYKDVTEPAKSPDDEQGIIYNANNTLKDNGLYDGRVDAQESIDRNIQFSSRSTLFSKEDKILYDNSRDKIDAPDVNGSGIYRAEQTLNEDGTYSGTLSYEQSTGGGSANFESVRSELSSDDATIYRDTSTPVDAPGNEQGTIYRADNNLKENGLYDARVDAVHSVEASVEFRNTSTLFREGTAIVYKNSRDAIEAPEATGSGLYRATQTINEDGTYDGTLDYSAGTGSGEVEFASLNSILRERNTTLYKMSNAPIEALSDKQGTIYDASNNLRDDGLYDGRLDENTSNEESVDFKSVSAEAFSQDSILYENSRDAIDSPSATDGGMYASVQTINQDGTYSGRLDYSTVDYQAIGSHLAVRSMNGKIIYEERFTNAKDTDIPAFTSSERGNLIYSKNQRGRFSGIKQVYNQEPTANLTQWWMNRNDLTQVFLDKKWVPDSSYTAGGEWMWRKVTVTYDLTYHGTEQDAYDEIDGGFYAAVGGMKLVSRVDRISNVFRLWRAIKVKKVEYDSTWYDETTDAVAT